MLPRLPKTIGLVLSAVLLVTACGSDEPAPTTTTAAPSTLPAETTSTTEASKYVEFGNLGLATVLPADWVLEQEMNIHGDGAMLYDAGDEEALIVIGRVSELEESITASEPNDVAVEVSRVFMKSFKWDGEETVSTEPAAVVGADAVIAQIRLDLEDGTLNITRTAVIPRADDMLYAILAYEGAFPEERISQGLEVLDRLALLDL